jgi:hypothetical protein
MNTSDEIRNMEYIQDIMIYIKNESEALNNNLFASNDDLRSNNDISFIRGIKQLEIRGRKAAQNLLIQIVVETL